MEKRYGHRKKDKKVLYQGYTLEETLNTDEGSYGSGAYVILNPDGVKTKATIYKIEKDKMNIILPTVQGSMSMVHCWKK